MANYCLCTVLSIALSIPNLCMAGSKGAEADVETNWRTYYRTRAISPTSGKTVDQLLREAIGLGATYEDLSRILDPYVFNREDYDRIKGEQHGQNKR